MIKKIYNIFCLGSFAVFAIFVIFFYFSEENVNILNKSRTFFTSKQNKNLINLPILKNDTNDIIEYSDDIEIYKKNKKKYTFWDLIGK